MIMNGGRGRPFVVSHREYLGDVITAPVAGQFLINSFPINPGNSLTFPWLSQIASNFEEYDIEGMLFHFKSTSSDALNSVQTSLGTVIMATQYNAASGPFTSKAEMENYQYATDAKPSVSNTHMIECDRSQSVANMLYVLPTTAVPAGQDPRLYNFGTFSIASVGNQGSSVNIGELWCTYQIALYKPKLVSALGDEVDFFHGNKSGATVSAAFPLGTAVYLAASPGNVSLLSPSNLSNMAVFTSGAGNNIINLPIAIVPKRYILYIQWVTNGASVAVTQPTVSFASAGVTQELFFNNTVGATSQNAGYAIPPSGVTTALMSSVSNFAMVPNTPASIVIGTAGVFPAACNCEFLIMEIPHLS